MRPRLANAVRESFSRRMAQDLPQFVAAETAGALKGGLLYRWQRTRTLNCYVYLQISAKMQDSFMVELSCSAGQFPLNLVAYGPNDIREGSVRFRLPELYREKWAQETRRVPWWWIGPQISSEEVTSTALTRALARKRPLVDEGMPIEEVLPLVDQEVRDAVDRIKRFGIPFFDQFARDHAGNG